MLVLLASRVKSLSSNVVSPNSPPMGNCLTLPRISPSNARVNPLGNAPAVTTYLNTALGTVVVARTDSVLIKLALMLPKSLSVFQVITLSTSPNIFTEKVLSLMANVSALAPNLVALTVNLYSLVTAG